MDFKCDRANLYDCVVAYFEAGNYANSELYTLCHDYMFAKDFKKHERLIELMNK